MAEDEDGDAIVKIVSELPHVAGAGASAAGRALGAEQTPRFTTLASGGSGGGGGFSLPKEYLKYTRTTGHGCMYDADEVDEAFVAGVNDGTLRAGTLDAWLGRLAERGEGRRAATPGGSGGAGGGGSSGGAASARKALPQLLSLSGLECAFEALERASFIGSALATSRRSREAALAQRAEAYARAYAALRAVEALRAHWNSDVPGALQQAVSEALAGAGGAAARSAVPASSRKRPREEGASHFPAPQQPPQLMPSVALLDLSASQDCFFVPLEDALKLLAEVSPPEAEAPQAPEARASARSAGAASASSSSSSLSAERFVLDPAAFPTLHKFWVWRRSQESQDATREASEGSGPGSCSGSASALSTARTVASAASAASAAPRHGHSAAQSTITTSSSSSAQISVQSVSRGHLVRSFQSLGAGDVPSELDAASLARAAEVDPALLPTPENIAALGSIFDESAAGNGGLGAGLGEDLMEAGEVPSSAAGTKAGFVAWKRTNWLGRLKSLMIGHDLRAHARLRALRTAMERVRVLLDLTRKREKLRRSMVKDGSAGALAVFPVAGGAGSGEGRGDASGAAAQPAPPAATRQLAPRSTAVQASKNLATYFSDGAGGGGGAGGEGTGSAAAGGARGRPTSGPPASTLFASLAHPGGAPPAPSGSLPGDTSLHFKSLLALAPSARPRSAGSPLLFGEAAAAASASLHGAQAQGPPASATPGASARKAPPMPAPQPRSSAKVASAAAAAAAASASSSSSSSSSSGSKPAPHPTGSEGGACTLQ